MKVIKDKIMEIPNQEQESIVKIKRGVQVMNISEFPETIREYLTVEKIYQIEEFSYYGTGVLIVNTNDKKIKINLSNEENLQHAALIQKAILLANLNISISKPSLDLDILVEINKDIHVKLRFNILHRTIVDSYTGDNVIELGEAYQIRVNNNKILNSQEIEGLFFKSSDKAIQKNIDTVFKYIDTCININNTPNIIISGSTGTGKTELQKHLISKIPFEQKVCIIQDTLDLNVASELPNADILQIKVKPHDSTSASGISAKNALIASLRQAPTWIVLSEIREKEIGKIFLKSLLTGHSGITTIHARNSKHTLKRLEEEIGIDNIQDYIDLVINLKKEWDEEQGKYVRKINDIIILKEDNIGNIVQLPIYSLNRLKNLKHPYDTDSLLVSKFFRGEL